MGIYIYIPSLWICPCMRRNYLCVHEAEKTRKPRGVYIYTVSQKTSHLWLGIIFTYTVRLQQFLEKNVPEKVGNQNILYFPPHLTNASALPRETGNPEIVFSLKCCVLFYPKKTQNIVYNITWSELNHPALSKRSTGCTKQDLRRECNILLSVTHMLCVSQVCHGVSRCVKDGSCSSSSLEWKLMDNF